MFTIYPGIYVLNFCNTYNAKNINIYKYMATTVAQCPPYGLASGTSLEVYTQVTWNVYHIGI